MSVGEIPEAIKVVNDMFAPTLMVLQNLEASAVIRPAPTLHQRQVTELQRDGWHRDYPNQSAAVRIPDDFDNSEDARTQFVAAVAIENARLAYGLGQYIRCTSHNPRNRIVPTLALVTDGDKRLVHFGWYCVPKSALREGRTT